MKQRLSIADVYDGDPLDVWHSWLSNELCPCAVKDYEPASFSAECEMADFGDIRLVRFKGSRQTFDRSRSLIKPSQSDDYLFAVVSTVSSAFQHNGHDERCRNGDALLIDTTRPHLIAHDQDAETMNVLIPRHILDTALGATNLAAGVLLNADEPNTGIIAAYLSRLLQAADDFTPESARRLGRIAIDLIASGFDDKLARSGHRRRDGALLVRAQAFIEDKLADLELDPALVAAFLGISLRRLHEIFLGEDLTVSDHIWERRLLRAARLIRNDGGRHVSISTIAYRTGFASPAHFSRRFKQRFGVTPSELRRAEGQPTGSWFVG